VLFRLCLSRHNLDRRRFRKGRTTRFPQGRMLLSVLSHGPPVIAQPRQAGKDGARQLAAASPRARGVRGLDAKIAYVLRPIRRHDERLAASGLAERRP
jgi:hypothetical protein